MYASNCNLSLIPSGLHRSFSCQTHDYYPCLLARTTHDDQNYLDKFHSTTTVRLETGGLKNIQQLTSDDFFRSATESGQYSSLLARVEYIGCVDKITGKAELRFYIQRIAKTTSYFVREEIPFFVYQSSSWSSISPQATRRIYGLNCRQLTCADLIIAITEQAIVRSKRSFQPDYSQQSPTKCLVERYMNDRISSNEINERKRRKINEDESP